MPQWFWATGDAAVPNDALSQYPGAMTGRSIHAGVYKCISRPSTRAFMPPATAVVNSSQINLPMRFQSTQRRETIILACGRMRQRLWRRFDTLDQLRLACDLNLTVQTYGSTTHLESSPAQKATAMNGSSLTGVRKLLRSAENRDRGDRWTCDFANPFQSFLACRLQQLCYDTASIDHPLMYPSYRISSIEYILFDFANGLLLLDATIRSPSSPVSLRCVHGGAFDEALRPRTSSRWSGLWP